MGKNVGRGEEGTERKRQKISVGIPPPGGKKVPIIVK